MCIRVLDVWFCSWHGTPEDKKTFQDPYTIDKSKNLQYISEIRFLSRSIFICHLLGPPKALGSGFGYFRCGLTETHRLKPVVDTVRPVVKGAARIKFSHSTYSPQNSTDQHGLCLFHIYFKNNSKSL